MNVVFYDATPITELRDVPLALAWKAGAAAYRFRSGYVDVPVTKWGDVFDWLAERRRGSVKSVQFWGHGNAGSAFIGDDQLSRARFGKLGVERASSRAGGGLGLDATFWFRTCNTAEGARGRLFMRMLSSALGCRVAAHTQKIPDLLGFQPGCVYCQESELEQDGYRWSRGELSIHALSGQLPRRW